MRENAVFRFDIKQGTEEWLAIRRLKFTASNASALITGGKTLNTLIDTMLSDYFSSKEFEEYSDTFKSKDMQRGTDYEDVARSVYELETGNSVRQIGCVTVGDYILASPDGLVTEKGNEEGLIEIKNHNDKVFTELNLTEKVDDKYFKQMQYQLWVTGYKWVDYFGYNPNFKKSYFLKRFYPDEEIFEKYERGVKIASEQLEEKLYKLKNKFGL